MSFMETVRRVWRWPVVVFLICFGAYLGNASLIPGGDARANMLVSLNLLKYHSFLIAPPHVPGSFSWTLEQSPGKEVGVQVHDWTNKMTEHYRKGLLKPHPPYYLVPTVYPDRYAGAFGIGAALTVLPVYALLNTVTDIASNRPLWWHSAKVTASLLTAGAAVLIFLTMRRFVPSLPAVLGALAFGLGTCAWSLSSQELWQQTPFLFFLSLGVWWLFSAKARPDCALYCGAAFGMATLCRPIGVIPVVFTGLYLLLAAPRHVFRYMLGGLPFALLLVLYNHYAFGSPFLSGQEVAADRIMLEKGATSLWQTPLAEGLAGLLFSPSRGLLVYSPVMVFGFIGAVMAWRDPRHYTPLILLQMVALVLCALSAKHFDWWGGFSYGPRRVVDIGGILTLLMIPVIARVWRTHWMRGVFVVLLLYSVAVQGIGAWSYSEVGWNNKNGQNIDQPAHRSRLWSLQDSQIVHYATHLQAEREKKQAFMRFILNRPTPIVSSRMPGEGSP